MSSFGFPRCVPRILRHIRNEAVTRRIVTRGEAPFLPQAFPKGVNPLNQRLPRLEYLSKGSIDVVFPSPPRETRIEHQVAVQIRCLPKVVPVQKYRLFECDCYTNLDGNPLIRGDSIDDSK